ncbi:MAG: NUDIX hydrolase [Chloroflexi bacterium]|nr:MAG: NUDIX hydrolase [Chloroflexota bacterium]
MQNPQGRVRLAHFIRRIPYLIGLAARLYRLIQPKYSIGVVAIIFNEQNQVLLVEHVYHPLHPWGLPGGWIGRNEAPDQTVKREIREELSMDIDPLRLVSAEITYRGHLDMAYLCQPKDAIGQMSDELLGYRWFDIDQLPPMKRFQYEAILQALTLVNEATELNYDRYNIR